MDNNAAKEQWIDEVLGSTAGMQRPMPGPGLTEKVMHSLQHPHEVRTIPFPAARWAAAAILLLGLNVGSVVYATGKKQPVTNTTTQNPLAKDLQLDNTYNY